VSLTNLLPVLLVLLANSPPVMGTPVTNLTPVSTTPVELVAKFAAVVVDTGGAPWLAKNSVPLISAHCSSPYT
jgi:hypothetical protein